MTARQNRSLIAILANESSVIWSRITREVSWAYRRKAHHSATLALITHTSGELPAQEAWLAIAKEVNRLRRNAGNALERERIAKAGDRHREYMRAYQKRKRTSRRS